ncbi:MAG TPA: hypothetical protein VF292_08325 [Rhodanobacteraceae bacterium]
MNIMAIKTKRLTVRATEAEFQSVLAQAHALRMSASKYLLTAGAAYASDVDQARHVSELVQAQTAKIVDALAAQNESLRDGLNKAFERLAGMIQEKKQ